MTDVGLRERIKETHRRTQNKYKSSFVVNHSVPYRLLCHNDSADRRIETYQLRMPLNNTMENVCYMKSTRLALLSRFQNSF
jgi:hypothetical protein